MSMSLARWAMPSSTIFAPSLTSAYTRRWTISSSLILRGVMPSAARCFSSMSVTILLGIASRLPGT